MPTLTLLVSPASDFGPGSTLALWRRCGGLGEVAFAWTLLDYGIGQSACPSDDGGGHARVDGGQKDGSITTTLLAI